MGTAAGSARAPSHRTPALPSRRRRPAGGTASQPWLHRRICKMSRCLWLAPGPNGLGAGGRGRTKRRCRKGPGQRVRMGSPPGGPAPEMGLCRRGNCAPAPPGRRPSPWKLHPQVRPAGTETPQMEAGTLVSCGSSSPQFSSAYSWLLCLGHQPQQGLASGDCKY